MVKNSFIWLKYTNMIAIAAYLVTYIIAFSAYDDSGTNYDEDSFEHNILKLMSAVGTAFTCAVISNWCLFKKGKIIESVICIACSVAQIPALSCAISAARAINRSALYYEDEIVEHHCNAAINMAYIIIGIVLVFLLLAIFSLIVSIKNRKIKDDDEWDTYEVEYVKAQDFHIPVIIVLMVSTAVCVFYLYSLLIIMLAEPFFIAFAIPMSLLLATEVKEWVENKRYILSAIMYMVYMYIVYGVFYRLFSDELHGFAFHYNALELIFPGFILIVNVVVSGVVAVRLIVKALKD